MSQNSSENLWNAVLILNGRLPEDVQDRAYRHLMQLIRARDQSLESLYNDRFEISENRYFRSFIFINFLHNVLVINFLSMLLENESIRDDSNSNN